MCTTAGNRLHNDVFNSVMKADMNFFETTPTGRILNRFSKDMDIIDKLLPFTLEQFLQVLWTVVSIFIIIGVALPIFLVSLLPCLALFVGFGWYFRNSSVQLKRIDGVARSPLFAYISETINGSTVVKVRNIKGRDERV